MRHVINILHALGMLLILALGAISGLFMVPLGLLLGTKKDFNGLTHFKHDFFFPWDNSHDGIDGSGRFQRTYPKLPVFLRRFLWTAIRNPTENLKRHALSITWDDTTLVVKRYLSNLVIPSDIEKEPGFMYNLVAQDHDGKIKQFYEYYFISRPFHFLGKERCVRIRIGYKIKDPSARIPGEQKAFDFSFNPLCVFGGDMVQD